MKTLLEQIDVMIAASNGKEIERAHLASSEAPWRLCTRSVFDWATFDYRIKEVADPYAELKAASKDQTKQIRIKGEKTWVDALNTSWGFDHRPEDYEIRNKPRKVKLLAWFDGAGLAWREEYHPVPPTWLRMPNQDIEGEVEE